MKQLTEREVDLIKDIACAIIETSKNKELVADMKTILKILS